MTTSSDLLRRLTPEYLPCVWWLAYAATAVAWCLGFPGWPYGPDQDASTAGALLVGLTPEEAGPVVVAVCLVCAAVNLALVAGRAPGHRMLVTTAWVTAALPILTVPDARLLLTVFRMLTGHPLGPAWPVVHQAVCVAGGLLTALAVRRRTRRHRTPAVWGRWATGVAVAAPLSYAAVRWCWALGIPVGATPEFLAPYTATGARLTEALLGALCVGAAWLTVGLVRPWGEAVPRWVPLVAGGRIPPLLVVLPAAAASVVLGTAGLALSRGLLAMAVGLIPATPSAAPANWGAWFAAPVWTLWGVSLAVATVAYHRRRRHPDRSTTETTETTERPTT